MRKQYKQFTAAEGYIIGFHKGDNVYYIEFNDLPRKYMLVQKESKSNGGGYGLYIKIKTAKAIAEVMPKAVLIGKVEDLKSDRYNQGVMFEKMVYEANGQTFRGKDSVRFYKSGDININGKEIQIKYEHARICYDRTLRNLSK
jgi:hypothetical protein